VFGWLLVFRKAKAVSKAEPNTPETQNTFTLGTAYSETYISGISGDSFSFSFDVIFPGGVFFWCGGGQDGMPALLPCHLYPTVAWAKELVPDL